MKGRAAGTLTASAVAAYALIARRWQLQWGATDDEARCSLPRDDLVAHADIVATRAITIHKQAATVWPWIAQLGQARGGFYSYDMLENMVGCDIHSADRILGELQTIEPGDEVRLAPTVALEVAAVDAPRALVLRGGVPMGEASPPYDFSWAFVLRDGASGTCRLLVRERYSYFKWWAPLLVEPVEVVSFLMSQKMLSGIRDRAEGRAEVGIV